MPSISEFKLNPLDGSTSVEYDDGSVKNGSLVPSMSLSDGTVQRLLSVTPTIVIAGDSITNQNWGTDSATYKATSGLGYWTWAEIELGGKFKLLNNAGVSGDRTDQLNARLSTQVLAYKPKYCFVHIGTNDIGQGITAATIIANLSTIYQTLVDNGIIPVTSTILPRGGTSALSTQASRRDLLDVNDWIVKYSRLKGWSCADFYRLAVDTSTLTNAAQAKADTSLLDTLGLHPLGKLARKMGLMLASLLNPLSPVYYGPSSNSWDGTNGAAGPIINPTMLGTTGGANTGVTGSVAQNWVGERVSGTGISAVASVVPISNLFQGDLAAGTVQQYVVSGAATTADELFHYQVTTSQIPTAGTVCVLTGSMTATASSGTIENIRLYAQANNSLMLIDCVALASNAGIGANSVQGLWQSREFTIPAGITQLTVGATIRTSAGANVTWGIKQIDILAV